MMSIMEYPMASVLLVDEHKLTLAVGAQQYLADLTSVGVTLPLPPCSLACPSPWRFLFANAGLLAV
ncbi:hypothetical protein DK37_29310 [Halomonas sp. SUBG004]|nr:hypothetical protein DK37_29310 [Halomonas sp. SUBG004]